MNERVEIADAKGLKAQADACARVGSGGGFSKNKLCATLDDRPFIKLATV